MARWEPDSRGRLEQAALALYGESGFENTTVAEIAGRAGLTERTFFSALRRTPPVTSGPPDASPSRGLAPAATIVGPAESPMHHPYVS